MQRVFVIFIKVMAVVSIANGCWMIAHAWSWFAFIPGVTDTGEANAHFIHDVGIAYVTCGIGLLWCLRHLDRAWPVFAGIALFNGGHAIGHVVEILAGQLPASHWLIDLPLVFLPSLALVLSAIPTNWQRLSGHPARPV